MPRDVSLEEFEQREVAVERKREEVFGRPLGRYHGNVRISVLNRLASQVLHQRMICHEVVCSRHGLRNGKRHHRGHGLEAPQGQFVHRVDQICVCEGYAPPAALEFEENVVRLYYLAQRRAGEALAVSPHRRRAVYPCEHRRLPCGALRKAFDAKAGVDRLRVPFKETPHCRADLGVHRVVQSRLSQTDAVDKKVDHLHFLRSIP